KLMRERSRLTAKDFPGWPKAVRAKPSRLIEEDKPKAIVMTTKVVAAPAYCCLNRNTIMSLPNKTVTHSAKSEARLHRRNDRSIRRVLPFRSCCAKRLDRDG